MSANARKPYGPGSPRARTPHGGPGTGVDGRCTATYRLPEGYRAHVPQDMPRYARIGSDWPDLANTSVLAIWPRPCRFN